MGLNEIQIVGVASGSLLLSAIIWSLRRIYKKWQIKREIKRQIKRHAIPDDLSRQQTTDASAQNPDASARNPDASARNPDASAWNPDASAQNPDASAQNPDASAQNPDASAQNPDVEDLQACDENSESEEVVPTPQIDPEILDKVVRRFSTDLEDEEVTAVGLQSIADEFLKSYNAHRGTMYQRDSEGAPLVVDTMLLNDNPTASVEVYAPPESEALGRDTQRCFSEGSIPTRQDSQVEGYSKTIADLKSVEGKITPRGMVAGGIRYRRISQLSCSPTSCRSKLSPRGFQNLFNEGSITGRDNSPQRTSELTKLQDQLFEELLTAKCRAIYNQSTDADAQSHITSASRRPSVAPRLSLWPKPSTTPWPPIAPNSSESSRRVRQLSEGAAMAKYCNLESLEKLMANYCNMESLETAEVSAAESSNPVLSRPVVSPRNRRCFSEGEEMTPSMTSQSAPIDVQPKYSLLKPSAPSQRPDDLGDRGSASRLTPVSSPVDAIPKPEVGTMLKDLMTMSQRQFEFDDEAHLINEEDSMEEHVMSMLVAALSGSTSSTETPEQEIIIGKGSPQEDEPVEIDAQPRARASRSQQKLGVKRSHSAENNQMDTLDKIPSREEESLLEQIRRLKDEGRPSNKKTDEVSYCCNTAAS